MAVSFDGNKLVIDMTPSFLEEGLYEIESKVRAHLDWLEASLKKIKLTSQNGL